MEKTPSSSVRKWLAGLLLASLLLSFLGRDVCLEMAVESGFVTPVRFFLALGGDPNRKWSERQQTTLHAATSWMGSSPDIVRILLAAGADVRAKDKSGRTPLHHHLNALFPNLELVKLLVDHGADVNEPDPDDRQPPLFRVVKIYRLNDGIADFLIEKGADPNAPDGFGVTILDHWAREENPHAHEVITYLLAKGASLKTLTNGRDPLYAAIEWVREENALVLLASGANPKAFANQTMTPLHLAAKFGMMKVCASLIASGADVNAVDADRRRPIDFAFSTNVYQLLLSHGAISRAESEPGIVSPMEPVSPSSGGSTRPEERRTCWSCSGNGRCKTCGGKGDTFSWKKGQSREKCERCRGSGRCSECGGKGKH
ncbi:MAG: ankyrin repeat domain-containing protein [Candidatus Ozemobacteraceae bacterium]